MGNKKNLRNMFVFLGLPILILLCYAFLNLRHGQKQLKYSEIIHKFRNHEVVEYTMHLGSGNMNIKLKDETKINYNAPSVNLMISELKDLVAEYDKENPENPMLVELIKPPETSWLMNAFVFGLMPLLILGVMFWVFTRRIATMGGDSGRVLGFNKAKTKDLADEGRKATFADVAGADEEKEELFEIVEFLKTPEKYNKLGARIPKGVLLIGPPGTGKTLLARAIAGEAGVPFFSISGSDFVEMFVGVGASRVRNLFEKAKKSSPCIIFIDEIDAVGRQRGAGLGGGHDEREQTLNQLLVEMDGFGINEGVIMVAATNRPDILDPALLRPGRFDRQIVVGYPDVKGREEILKVHAKGKPFAPNVILKTIAKTTAGFTGADLENLMNESALLAARKNLKVISMKEVEEATIKVVMGTEKKSRVITEKDKKMTAYHEAAHAIARYYCKSDEKVHEISIIPRGMAGGYTLSLPEKDRFTHSKRELMEKIVVLMGGHVAESMILEDLTSGASHDIEQATKMARSMVTEYGMSEKLGPIAFEPRNHEVFIGRDMNHTISYSEQTASQIDDEIRKIVKECYAKTEKIIKENIEKLHEVAKYLLNNEKMNGEQFYALMDGTN